MLSYNQWLALWYWDVCEAGMPKHTNCTTFHHVKRLLAEGAEGEEGEEA